MPESQVPDSGYLIRVLGNEEVCMCICGNKVQKFSSGEAWHCQWCYMATNKETQSI